MHKQKLNLLSQKLLLIVITGIVLSSCINNQKVSEKSKQIDDLVNYCYENNMFNGAILVTHNGNLLYKNALGIEDFTTGKKLSPISVFNIGSVSKQFTAMAVLILKEQGKLTLDDKISNYFPELPNSDKISIRNLLTHTSGYPDYTRGFSRFRVPGRPGDFIDDISDSDVFDFLVEMDSVNFEPGENCSYSNSGYVILSMIVAKASGVPFHQFMATNVFKPLEMTNSLVWNNTKPVLQNKTIGYNEYGDMDDYNILTSGPGGIYTTVEDLFKYDKALYSEILITNESLEEAFTPSKLNNGSDTKLRLSSSSTYGFGWILKRDSINNIVFHDGGFNGYSAYLYRDLNTKDAIILLSNKGTNGPLYPIQEAILKILNNEPYNLPKIPISIKLKSLIDSMGIERAYSHFQEVKRSNELSYNFNINQLNGLGYYYINKQKLEEAKAVFKLNAELYPDDANVYDSYAETFMHSGDNKNAIIFYKKSLELSPENTNAIEMLKRIENEK